MVEGKIISSSALRNNAWHYMIQTSPDNKVCKYTYFGKNGAGLDASRFITFEFESRHNDRYGTSYIIDGNSVRYGEIVTDSKSISEFLMKQLHLTRGDALSLIQKYDKDTLPKIFNEPEVLKIFKDRPYYDTLTKYKTAHVKCELEIELTNLGISTQHHEKIGIVFKTLDNVKSNVYKLYFSADVPFEVCDKIGMSLGYDIHHEERLAAFVDDIFTMWNSTGSMYVSQYMIKSRCSNKKIQFNKLLPFLRCINCYEDPYYTAPKYYDMEIAVEQFCHELLENPRPVEHEIAITDYQLIGVRNALKYNLSIITGGPGRGKSYTIGTIIEKLHTYSKIYVLAPTGAAVERLRCEERINLYDGSVNIQTIHSFVYNNVDNKQVTEVLEEPKYAKETGKETIVDLFQMYREVLIIIDEMSMVDLELFYEFIQLLGPVSGKIRLVLLGDVDQLPSIKGGNVLHDMIKSDIIPYTRLFKNHRTENPEINENAEYAIRGENLDPRGNFIWLEASDEKAIKTRLLESLESYDIHFENSCILVPMRKSGVCTNSLNPILQNYYNPLPEAKSKELYRKGDKVIQGTNNKEKEIYNGSIMIVDDVEYVHRGEYCRTSKMLCRYYQNECDIGSGTYREIPFHRRDGMPPSNPNTVEYNKIDLAYAMTVHKAQGKGYKTVVIIMHSQMRYMLNRQLLYTAITRAKNLCIIISDESALFECQKEASPRITNLFRERKTVIDFMEGFRNIHRKLATLGHSCMLDDFGLELADLRTDSPKYQSAISVIHNRIFDVPDIYHMIRYA